LQHLSKLRFRRCCRGSSFGGLDSPLFERAVNGIFDGLAHHRVFGTGAQDQPIPVVHARQREQLARPPLICVSHLERPEQVLHLDVGHDGQFGLSDVDGRRKDEESPRLGNHRTAMLAERGVKNASGKSGVGGEDLADIARRALCAEMPDPLGASRIETKHDDTPQKMGGVHPGRDESPPGLKTKDGCSELRSMRQRRG